MTLGTVLVETRLLTRRAMDMSVGCNGTFNVSVANFMTLVIGAIARFISVFFLLFFLFLLPCILVDKVVYNLLRMRKVTKHDITVQHSQ